jgi:hypothetical protein
LTIFEKGGTCKDDRVPAEFFIVFTAECNHAGSKYERSGNRRLFFKAMPSHFKLPEKEGGSVNNLPFPGPYCKNGGGHAKHSIITLFHNGSWN